MVNSNNSGNTFRGLIADANGSGTVRLPASILPRSLEPICWESWLLRLEGWGADRRLWSWPKEYRYGKDSCQRTSLFLAAMVSITVDMLSTLRSTRAVNELLLLVQATATAAPPITLNNSSTKSLPDGGRQLIRRQKFAA